MQNIDYHHISETCESGFAVRDGVHIWTTPPSHGIDDWRWEARRWNGAYDDGCPRMVAGIGAIEGRAANETEAVAMAFAAARLVGCQPADVAHLSINSPQVTHLVAVADGEDERVES